MAATGSYTITPVELANVQDKWQTLQRLPEFQQLVAIWQGLDTKYGLAVTPTAGVNNLVNAIPQRSVNTNTRLVSVDTGSVVMEHQFPFPFGTNR